MMFNTIYAVYREVKKKKKMNFIHLINFGALIIIIIKKSLILEPNLSLSTSSPSITLENSHMYELFMSE